MTGTWKVFYRSPTNIEDRPQTGPRAEAVEQLLTGKGWGRPCMGSVSSISNMALTAVILSFPITRALNLSRFPVPKRYFFLKDDSPMAILSTTWYGLTEMLPTKGTVSIVVIPSIQEFEQELQLPKPLMRCLFLLSSEPLISHMAQWQAPEKWRC